MTATEPEYEVVWPKSPRGVQARPLAPRLHTLEGARIAFVWDYMFRGEEIFPIIADELQRRFAGIEIIGYDTFGNIHGPDEARLVGQLPAGLLAQRADAVVCGNGC